MATPYQKQAPDDLRKAAYNKNPLSVIGQTGQGTQSRPVPPKQITLGRKLLPTPTVVKAPGAAGTI